MIRKVHKEDAAAIAAIYNHYIATLLPSPLNWIPVREEEMWTRIQHINGRSIRTLYMRRKGRHCWLLLCAQGWKEKAAYNQSAETTIYLAPSHTGKGIGKELMLHLIEECRRYELHALIACITEGNEAELRPARKVRV